MNKTVTVNISGFVFYIEEEAYNVLSTYLNRIKSLFKSEESADEIVEDVEARIGELFKERLNGVKEVVNMTDVEEVIQIMGKPEDYMDESSYNSSHRAYEDSSESSTNRKLYRDEDDKILGGVCTGLAHYFNLDVSIIRIIFILVFLFGTAGGWIYLILWIVLPKAESTAEKLRMRGERITVENIKKKVNDLASEASLSKANNGIQKSLSAAGDLISGSGKVLGKAFTIFLAVIFGLIGVGLLIGLIAMLVAPDSAINISSTNIDPAQIVDLVFHGATTFYLLLIGIVLLFLAPIILLFYYSIRLLTGTKYRPKQLLVSLLSAFVIGIILASVGGARLHREYRAEGDVEETKIISSAEIDNLHVQLLADGIFHSSIKRDHHYHNNLDLLKIENGDLYNGANISMRTRSSATDDYIITILKESQGQGEIRAIEYAEGIDFEFKVEGNTLLLAPYFTTDLEDEYRDQKVKIEIAVPDGKTISMDKNTRRVDLKNVRNGSTYIYKDGHKELYNKRSSKTDDEKTGHHKITMEKKDGKIEIDIESNIDEEQSDEDEIEIAI